MKVVFKCDWCAKTFDEASVGLDHEAEHKRLRELPPVRIFGEGIATKMTKTAAKRRCRPYAAGGCDGENGYKVGCQWCMQYNPSDPGR